MGKIGKCCWCVTNNKYTHTKTDKKIIASNVKLSNVAADSDGMNTMMSNNPKCHTTDKTFNFAHDASFRAAVATVTTYTTLLLLLSVYPVTT